MTEPPVFETGLAVDNLNSKNSIIGNIRALCSTNEPNMFLAVTEMGNVFPSSDISLKSNTCIGILENLKSIHKGEEETRMMSRSAQLHVLHGPRVQTSLDIQGILSPSLLTFNSKLNMIGIASPASSMLQILHLLTTKKQLSHLSTLVRYKRILVDQYLMKL